jgi:hypothetical protein
MIVEVAAEFDANVGCEVCILEPLYVVGSSRLAYVSRKSIKRDTN